jgi:hypothetical protein
MDKLKYRVSHGAVNGLIKKLCCGGRAAEAFESLFSHIDGKIRDEYGVDGCGRKVVGTAEVDILTQQSPCL